MAVLAVAATPESARSDGPTVARTTPVCADATVVAADARAKARARRAVLCLLNRERVTRALPALRWSRSLATAAQNHTYDMRRRGYFSHVTPESRGPRQRVRRAGYRGRTVGETLAWGEGPRWTPAQLVADLMRSPPHRRVILHRRLREAGVGIALDAPDPGVRARGVTLTVNFGRR